MRRLIVGPLIVSCPCPQSSCQQLGVIRDDGVRSPIRESDHRFHFIHSPDEKQFACRMYIPDELPIHEIVVRDDVLDGQLGPVCQMICSVANKTQWDTRIT